MVSEEQPVSQEGEREPVAFVLMPFEPEFDRIYEDHIVPALESAGYSVQRADSSLDQQNILKDIVRGIDAADLVVAEVTSLAPNVLYELGLAHGLLKPTVMLTQALEDVPFDLRSYRMIAYSTHYGEVQRLQAELARIASLHTEGGISFGNPVADFALSVAESRVAGEPGAERRVRPAPEEATVEEEGEPGLLDFVVGVVEGYEGLTERIMRIGEMSTEATGKMDGRTIEMQSLGRGKKGMPGTAARVHKIAKGIASDMVEYASNLEELPGLRAEWERLTENMTGFLSLASVERVEDRQDMLKLIQRMRENLEVLRGFLDAIHGGREAIEGMRGVSRDLNRAVAATGRSLDGLMDEVSVGESYNTRMINILSERLEQNAAGRDEASRTGDGAVQSGGV